MSYCTVFRLYYKLPDLAENKDLNEFVQKCKQAGIKIPHQVSLMLDDRLKLESEIEDYLYNQLLPECDKYEIQGLINEFGLQTYWYDYVEDMLKLSTLFPNVVFILEGEGESPDDLWKKYFKNGKMQECYAQITFPPFDENKLK